MSKAVITSMNFPNGDPCFSVSVGRSNVGIVVPFDGGYVAWGKRKPVATVEIAARQLIDRAISKHDKEIRSLRVALRYFPADEVAK